MFTKQEKSGIIVMLSKKQRREIMSIKKKSIVSLVIMLLLAISLCTTVQAASVSIRPSASKVTMRKQCISHSFIWRKSISSTI